MSDNIPNTVLISGLPKRTRYLGKAPFHNAELFTVPLTDADKRHIAEATTGKERDRVRHARERQAERAYDRAVRQHPDYLKRAFSAVRFVGTEQSDPERDTLVGGVEGKNVMAAVTRRTRQPRKPRPSGRVSVKAHTRKYPKPSIRTVR